jgi:hypothetical protein
MRSLIAGVAGLIALATAQSGTGSSSIHPSTASSPSTASGTLSSSANSILTNLSAITVATASAQFTNINDAVSYAQESGIPSISVLAGTYSAVTVAGTQTLTISGPTASVVSGNKVVIKSNSTGGSVSLSTSGGRGLTLRNVNLTNTATDGVGPAVSARGVNLGIYTCALVSSTQGVYEASYGITLIANSLVQGTDKLFYNYPTVYVYESTIIPTSSGSSIFYGKGAAISGTDYNATLVVDSSSVQGSANNVYLATPNGDAGLINVVYRNTSLSSVIAASGVYSTACSAPGSVFGEFQNSGAGSYSENVASRGDTSCDYLFSTDQVSAYTMSKIFANAFSGFASGNLSWVDSSVLESIKNSDAAQILSAPAVPSASSTASAGTAVSSTCATPTPSATLIVSQKSQKSRNATVCKYADISAAISALPDDDQPYTIRIEAGQYNEQISITRNGKVTLIGESDDPANYSSNEVTVHFSRGELTNAGKNEQTPVLNVKKTGSSPDFAAYNINFVNTYPQTPNTAALAADYYGSNFAAYGCAFVGFQDTLLANQGVQVFANSYVEGSVDMVWGFSTAYFYRSVISSNTAGAYIAAQGRVADTISGYVFDECKVTYKESTYGETFGSTHLGRPYSNYSTVVYKNSYLDKHINPDGWTIWTTGSPQTSNVVFGEFNNTGPGSWQTGSTRPSYATKMTLEEVAPYSLSNWIGNTSFIDHKAWNYPSPFSANHTPTPNTTGISTSIPGPTHPESGKVPPQDAVIVSQNGEGNGSFSNISAALASLPNDLTNQTIFIYAGEYLIIATLTEKRSDKLQDHTMSNFLPSIVPVPFVSSAILPGSLARRTRTTKSGYTSAVRSY